MPKDPISQQREIISIISSMDDIERVELFDSIKDKWCMYCGDEQPGGRSCQCQNDD